VAIDHSSPEAEAESRERVASLAAAWRRATSASAQAGAPASTAPALATAATLAPPARPACGLRRQVALLFGRSLRQVLRDRPTNVGRASSQLSSAIVFASIYWRMKRTQSSIQDRMGLLQVRSGVSAVARDGGPA
jgi:hypothetical protein